MKFVYFSLIAAFALVAGVFALPSVADLTPSSPSQVQVKLQMAGNTNVTISITNTGPESLRLVKLNGLLSGLDVNKIAVTKEGESLSAYNRNNTDVIQKETRYHSSVLTLKLTPTGYKILLSRPCPLQVPSTYTSISHASTTSVLVARSM